ncbi:MAG TPA: amidohydrolase family protein [Caulobacterales bacterium]|nr:amidohydrolase family protein [Caulobacterales bacterium]
MAARDLRIVDPHVHFWDLSRARYAWLQDDPLPNNPAGDMSPIAHRNYLPSDYRRDVGDWRVEKIVHVECGLPRAEQVGETLWLEALADREGFPTGLVVGADMFDPELEAKLEAHAAQKRVRGVRQIVCWHADPLKTYTPRDMLMDDAWWAGFAKLARHGLAFDLQLYPTQMRDAARRLSNDPNIPVIVNHAGLPTDRDEAGLAIWRTGLRALAELPWVSIKISGLGITHRTPEAARATILRCIDIFGVTRAMFASDFPVDSVHASFDATYRAFDEATQHFSADERAALFAENAEAIYKI